MTVGENNYDRINDVLNTTSYVKSMPLALRAMKLQKLLQARDEKLLALDRDSMMFEDDFHGIIVHTEQQVLTAISSPKIAKYVTNRSIAGLR